jgi:hypothetical protein
MGLTNEMRYFVSFQASGNLIEIDHLLLSHALAAQLL